MPIVLAHSSIQELTSVQTSQNQVRTGSSSGVIETIKDASSSQNFDSKKQYKMDIGAVQQ